MKAVEWMATVPWCITAPALEAMVAIAERAPLPDAAERIYGRPRSLAMRGAKRRDDSDRMQMRDGVAVIRIDGPIYRYADFFYDVSGGVTTEHLARDLQVALDDPRVQAILFAIDSPGGEATGIGELADAIYAARGAKPTIAYVEGMGASAAYWIASAADEVWVDASGWLGSIGTVLSMRNPAAQPQPARMLEIVSSQSPKKRPDPATEAGRAYMQSLADDMTEVFIAAVVRNRGMTRDQVLAVEGGMRVGAGAVTAGLADRLGSEEGAIAALIERAEAAQRPALITRPSAAHQEESMDLREFFAKLFGGARDAGLIASDGTPAPVAQSLLEARPLADLGGFEVEPAPAAAAEQAEIARLRAELASRDQTAAAAAQQAQQAAAAAFAEGLVRDGKALPAEVVAIAAAHLEAAKAGPAALAAVEGAFRARPAHTLTTELVVVAEAGGPLPQPGGEPGLSDEERRAMLGMTPLGRAALKARPGTSA